MINPNSLFGRAMLVFFWGGLAANIVGLIWYMFTKDPLTVAIAWCVPFVNMALVTLKNILIPVKAKK